MRNIPLFYALAAIALGLTALFFRDVPLMPQLLSDGLRRGTVGVLSGGALILSGAWAIWGRSRQFGFLALTVFYGVYALIMPGWTVIEAPLNVGAWLGPAEIGGMAMGGLALFAVLEGRIQMATAARIIFGLCAIEFALAHFVYADITASMVPAWMPGRMGWAYATGIFHGLAGLAMVSGVRSRLAATLEAAMCGVFVLLVHIPRVIASPDVHVEWTMLATATMIAAAALAIRLAPEHATWRLGGAYRAAER